MNCSKCMDIPHLNPGAASVFITVPTQHHEEAILAAGRELQLAVNPLSSGYMIQTEDFESFVDRLSRRYFNQLEQKDIMLLPLKPGEALSWEALAQHKSLLHWKEWYLGKDLLDILERRSMQVVFQPILEAATGKIFAYEALNRGVRADGTIISPTELFEKARKMDLLFNLDKLCREASIAETARHGIARKTFVNFNPNAIYDPEKCLRSTMAAIVRHGLRPEQFVFEVLESEHVEDYEHLKTILDYYRERGFGVALDDMGTGYHRAYNHDDLYPDFIKIAREVIEDIHQNPGSQEIFREYLQAARAKGVMVIAEGVEKEEEYRYVREQGADLVQGYYFAKPSEIPLEELA